MNNTGRTHGPWQGIDFNPVDNLNRTRALCPSGWLVLSWYGLLGHAKTGDAGTLVAQEVHGVAPAETPALIEALEGKALEHGFEEWPEGRMFIGIVELDRHEDGADWTVELLRAPSGEPAFADLLPTAECPKCRRQAPLFPCGQCKALMCEDCGDEHTPPDCPPAWEAHIKAMDDLEQIQRKIPGEIKLAVEGYAATYRLFSSGGPAPTDGLLLLPLECVAALTAGKSIVWPEAPQVGDVSVGSPPAKAWSSPETTLRSVLEREIAATLKTEQTTGIEGPRLRALRQDLAALREPVDQPLVSACPKCQKLAGDGVFVSGGDGTRWHLECFYPEPSPRTTLFTEDRDGSATERARLLALGKEFRRLREHAGFGLRGLASALDVSVTTLSRIERGGPPQPDPALQAAMHPAGACTCGGGGGGTCEWCWMDQARDAPKELPAELEKSRLTNREELDALFVKRCSSCKYMGPAACATHHDAFERELRRIGVDQARDTTAGELEKQLQDLREFAGEAHELTDILGEQGVEGLKAATLDAVAEVEGELAAVDGPAPSRVRNTFRELRDQWWEPHLLHSLAEEILALEGKIASEAHQVGLAHERLDQAGARGADSERP